MTKARTRGQARRARKQNHLGLPEITSPAKREANGRVQRPHKSDTDPDRAALDARCRHAGLESTRANRREARRPQYGCTAGRALLEYATPGDEFDRLWDAVQHMRRVQAAYDRAIDAPSRYPQSPRVLTPPDAMTADASTPSLDTRSEEEAAADATRAHLTLCGWLANTDPTIAHTARRVVIYDDPCTDPTGLLWALLCVSDGMRGEAPTYRGRG